MRTGAGGLEIIKRNEGVSLHAYRDVVGVLTIGYGHTGPDVYEGRTITQAQAEQMLLDRLAHEFEPAVNEAIGDTPTTQAQFDAMVSLAYNIGAGRIDNPATPQDEGTGFRGSRVAEYHRARDYARAADAFRLWNRAGGRVLAPLTRRREEERAMYLSSSIVVPQPTPTRVPDNLAAAYLAVVRLDVPLIKLVQEALAARGLYTGRIDGDFGKLSKAALGAYLEG